MPSNMEKHFSIKSESTPTPEELRRFKDPIRMQILRNEDEASAVSRVTMVVAGTPTVSLPRAGMAQVFPINLLAGRQLRRPLTVIIEPDGDGYIARTPDLPLYGSGDDPINAIEALNREIASLYEDLQQDDNFTEDWLRIKAFLRDNLL